MWYEIIKALIAYLKKQPDLADVDIQPGQRQPLPDRCRVIDVRRGGSDVVTPYDASRGQETIWIECWELADDNADAYRLLAELEGAAIRAIDAWVPGTQTIAGAVINTKILAVRPDGDLFRPHVGCRIELSAQWRMVN